MLRVWNAERSKPDPEQSGEKVASPLCLCLSLGDKVKEMWDMACK